MQFPFDSDFEQKPGEHVQVFVMRVERNMRRTAGAKTFDDTSLLNRSLLGLYPSIRDNLPTPPPSTLDELFVFADKLEFILPSSDPYWRKSGGQQIDSVNVEVNIVNEYAAYSPVNPTTCYRCLAFGHYAWQCANKRVPKPTRRAQTIENQRVTKTRWKKRKSNPRFGGGGCKH